MHRVCTCTFPIFAPILFIVWVAGLELKPRIPQAKRTVKTSKTKILFSSPSLFRLNNRQNKNISIFFKGYLWYLQLKILVLKWSPSFLTITNILDGQLLTNKIEIIKLFVVLGGRKDGFKLCKTSDMTLCFKMYAFFYINGPAYISQHSLKIKIVEITCHETFHHKKKIEFIYSDLSSKGI